MTRPRRHEPSDLPPEVEQRLNLLATSVAAELTTEGMEQFRKEALEHLQRVDEAANSGGQPRRPGHRGSLDRIQRSEAVRRVWRVKATLADGEEYDEYVLARSSVDAAVVLGDHIREARGVEPDGQAGITDIDAFRAAGECASLAINRDQRSL